jgi:hypothetical protein
VGSVPIKTPAVQIRGFCLPTKKLGAGSLIDAHRSHQARPRIIEDGYRRRLAVGRNEPAGMYQIAASSLRDGKDCCRLGVQSRS